MASEGRSVYIRLRVKPEKREEWLGLIRNLERDVKANEKGALVFEVMQAADPNEFVMFECFASAEAQKTHQQAPYHVAMAPAGWACLDGEPHIEQLTPIAPE